MVQPVVRPGDMTSIPETHFLEKGNRAPQDVIYAHMHPQQSIHQSISVKNKNIVTIFEGIFFLNFLFHSYLCMCV